MKIVHVCLCGTFGEDYAYQDNLLPKYHKKLGHEVTVIAPVYCKINTQTGEEELAPSGTKYLSDGIKLIRLIPFIKSHINIRLHTFKGLYKTLINESPDLLFVHGIDSPSYYYCLKYARKNPRISIVFDNHADWNNSYHNKFAFYWAKYIIKNLIAKPALRLAKQFYGVTPARCKFLTEMYGIPKERIKLLPFGADDNELNIKDKNELRVKIRNQYNIGENDFLIVTGGKIDRRKNIHLLAEVVSKIDNSNIKLLIFGAANDEMKEYFSRIKDSRIIQIGWVSSNSVYQYFYAADFVMFPGLHSVLWEQMLATSVPCAITRLDGFEYVNFNDNCILMDGNTVDYYIQIIEKVTSDHHFYNTLKQNAQSKLSEQFMYSKIAQQVIDDLHL